MEDEEEEGVEGFTRKLKLETGFLYSFFVLSYYRRIRTLGRQTETSCQYREKTRNACRTFSREGGSF